jgi:hypothetical protein
MGWAGARWTRLVPALAGLIGLGIVATRILFDDDAEAALAALAFAVALGGIGLVYHRRLPDFALLAAAVGCAMLYLIAAGGRVLFAAVDSDFDTPIPYLVMLGLMIAWVVGLIAGTAKLLARLRQSMAAAHD